MAIGPGSYDKECTEIREKNHADGVMVLVFGGDKGEGFSAQLTAQLTLHIPQILRTMANQIEQDNHKLVKP